MIWLIIAAGYFIPLLIVVIYNYIQAPKGVTLRAFLSDNDVGDGVGIFIAIFPGANLFVVLLLIASWVIYILEKIWNKIKDLKIK